MFWPLAGTNKKSKSPPKSGQSGPSTPCLAASPFSNSCYAAQKRENTTRLQDFGWLEAGSAMLLAESPSAASCQDMAGFKRLRATAGQGPNYVGPSCGDVGLCWLILRAMSAQLGAMLDYLEGYVGRSWGLCRPILKPMVAHVDPCWAKRSEKWEQQKNTVKRRIFWWLAAYLAAMLAYLGVMLVYLGATWAHLGGYVGLCWPILELCWPILRPMLAHLGAMLAHLGAMLAHLGGHVGPSWGLCWPILSHKIRKVAKSGKSTKHRKTRGFLAGGSGSAAGGAAPLSYGEERNAFGYATARGPLAGLTYIKGCCPLPPTPWRKI